MKKNFKLISVILVFMILFCISACSKAGNEKEKNNVSETVSNTEVNSTTKVKKTDSLLTDNVYMAPLSNATIYVNTPDLHSIESGYTRVFLEDNVKLLSFTGIDYTEASSVSEAFEISYKRWTGNLMNYLGIRDESPDNANLTYENITVHGIETLKFKGTVKVGFNPIYDAYIYGYAFIYDGVPCSIMGAVIDESQPQSEKEYIEKAADAMMESVRSEP